MMNPQPKKLRIVFMGTAAFALPTMKAVVTTEEAAAVVTQPDRPKGRGRKVAPPPIKALALSLGLPVLQPEKVKDPLFIAQLTDLEPELIVVAAFGQILPAALLNIPPLGCVNVHPSLLPKYRGAAPINWAIIRGEARTGVTTYLMDPGMDTGAILLQREVEIGPDETAEELGERLAAIGGQLVIEAVEGLKQGTLLAKPQDENAASYAPLFKKADGLIPWQGSAAEIRNRIRGLVPWPVAYTMWQGKQIKIYRGRIGEGIGTPGEIISLDSGIEVACGKGSIFIEELQIEGGKRIRCAEFCRGHRLTVGERLG
jgi:methionyl-tRNA formyltransferase